jgi:nitrile hydratase
MEMTGAFDNDGSAPNFVEGQLIHISNDESMGHCRTPIYVRGAPGKIISYIGSYRNPEDLAYGGLGVPVSPLYWVEILLADIWPHYSGAPKDTLLVEIYEHWLRKDNKDT